LAGNNIRTFTKKQSCYANAGGLDEEESRANAEPTLDYEVPHRACQRGMTSGLQT
jgi:hypothetical protein